VVALLAPDDTVKAQPVRDMRMSIHSCRLMTFDYIECRTRSVVNEADPVAVDGR
jgi:hypothetical protein